MKFGMSISNLGIYTNFEELIALAHNAEEAGWDEIFLWDHILHKPRADSRAVDPWIALAAIAANTKKIMLGPMVARADGTKQYIITIRDKERRHNLFKYIPLARSCAFEMHYIFYTGFC